MAKKRKAARRKVATMTVMGIGKMSKQQRRDIAKWLRHYATQFTNNGDAYTEGRFRAGFQYR